MIHHSYEMQAPGSLPGARLVTYIQEYTPSIGVEKRPLVLICPGGGYSRTSDREAEPIALAFLAMGYHAAVLRYSCAPAVFPTALLELATAISFVRSKAKDWHVQADKIVVQGCSAGGHLAASLGIFWKEDFIAQGIGLEGKNREILRPNGMILCYPVITSGEYAHRGSFECLLGEKYGQLGEKVSLEKQVNAQTPKTFLWHTVEDQAVPVQNSILFASALLQNGISTEFHMYPKGKHGLALANWQTATADGGAVQEECQSWIDLAHTWLQRL